ncbi:MAG: tetratricopeptide repeat protein [candidate division WOR-3 bacterium]|nr:MAG: tetratricopeptide repeat protein [candidate division WOR-3 bacterium]
MILFIILFSLQSRADSLENLMVQDPQIETLVQLNRYYLAEGEYHKSMELLKKCERYFMKEAEKALIAFETGNAYMFAGDIVRAHDMFIRVVSTYPKLGIANDVADRLYLIEAARDDTVQLKRLVNVVRLFETEQYPAAVDSARRLLKTVVAPYAYYYLALVYTAMDDVPQALGALTEMRNEHPVHSVYDAVLLEADIYIRLDRRREAREILEDLIVLRPNTIYALRARQRLSSIDSSDLRE